ncbi:GTPase and tRNA-U34 5-formylation enzyme TrmE [Thioalkalivibrio nitratireducens DSM 14787]|uniref:tRNA modification GTPase MnmE n=1 Tax=Thioalkalivibrio nitratireducens (strain DSM 14787 / UNIQEM 213 / ALEN2) TaxID=1255043 RepID=L0E2G1_THIND|nr:tRNA uridine-5-carboxymethylaminomethyl(34) synthesis GTPase MnmE [Thioalkalivibrio nitratireducens]AGA35432.1 GTPase and tRNA-U34 5-formylation enzyme TrmE [Thioalkalivibrio nitratireducens DSM 14787]
MAGGADTIVAVATPPGVGGIGVLRLSGPRARVVAEAIAGPRLPVRCASHRRLRTADGAVVDDGLVLFFPEPASYTGEDVVELQGHGSPVLLQQLQDAALQLGARLARPGEFTERAFLNDRMDLAQAEAVADLIHAQTAAAARLARSSLDGALARELEPVAAEIRALRVLIEAEIDFGETDLESTAAADVATRAAVLAASIDDLVVRLRPMRVFGTGLRLALVGAPNVGKSSLMNRLADADVAIVTEVPGTTRDVLRAPIAIDGIPVELIDTAGLRESDDAVERIGIERARGAAASADIIVEILDLTRPAARAPLPDLPGIPVLQVWNKADLMPGAGGEGLRVSAVSGEGVDTLRAAVRAELGLGDSGEQRFSVRSRHLEGLSAAVACLRRIHAGVAPDLIAEELRLAERALEALLGRGDHEELLGAIFAGFCIGK